MFNDYRSRSLEGANGVELIVALYDGLIRFLHRAAICTDNGEVYERRVAVRRCLDILMYLQSQLRTDVGEGRPAAVFAEFYAATFAQIVRASRDASREQFEQAIAHIRNVREAWSQIAKTPEASKMLPSDLQTLEEQLAGRARLERPSAAEDRGYVEASNWTA